MSPGIARPQSSSQVSRVSRRIPAPSAPSTSATRRSARSAPRSFGALASRPMTHSPAAFSATSVRARLTARSSGTVSNAPDAALAITPVSSGALRSCSTTAAAPKAAALRRVAPMLRGSVTWSSTSSGPGRSSTAASVGGVSRSASRAAP
jgi:hypothetical protein